MLTNNFPERGLRCETLSADDLFAGLAPAGNRRLRSIEKRVTMGAGSVVFSSGDKPLHIYVQRNGRAAVVHDREVPGEQAFPVELNCVYGVTEALSDTPFDVGIRTITDSDFDVIDREDFLLFVREEPALSFRLAEMLSRMYQKMVQRIREQ